MEKREKNVRRLKNATVELKSEKKYLNIEEIQLDRISGIHVHVRKEVAPSKKQYLLFIDTLLSKALGRVEPYYWRSLRLPY